MERRSKEDNDNTSNLPVYSSARSQQDMSTMVSVLSQVIGNSSSSSSAAAAAADYSSVDGVHVNPLTLIPQTAPHPDVHQYAELLRSDNNITDLNFDASRSFNQYSSSSGLSFDVSQSLCNTSAELPSSNEEQQHISNYYDHQQEEEEEAVTKFPASRFGKF